MAAADSKVGAKARSVVESHLTDDDTRHYSEKGAIIGGLETIGDSQLLKRPGTIVDVVDNSEDSYGLK